AVFRKILGIDVAHRPLVDDAQAGAKVIAGIDPLHLALLDADGLVALALDEELDEIRARSQRALDHAVHEGLLEQWHQLECTGAGSFPPPLAGEGQGGGLATGSRTSPITQSPSRVSTPAVAMKTAE